MITIHKYPLALKDDQVVELPAEHSVLSVGYDGNNQLCAWVQVNTDSYLVPIHFHVIGTGNPIQRVGPFIGTVRDTFTAPGALIWHIFKGE